MAHRERRSSLFRGARSREDVIRKLRKYLPLAEDSESSRSLEDRSGILDALPMLCKGLECPVASRCPVSSRREFVGTPCILQTIEAYRHFRDYVISLEISPEHYTDLQMVVDLVRTHVLSWWIDQLLAVDGITQTNVTMSGGSTSLTRVSHPLLAEQRALIREREHIYKELMASRRARLEKEAMERRGQIDFARMLAQVSEQMREAASRLQVVEHYDALPGKGTEYPEFEEDDE